MLFGAFFIVFANLVVDLLYAVIDPRVRLCMDAGRAVADGRPAPLPRSARPAGALPDRRRRGQVRRRPLLRRWRTARPSASSASPAPASRDLPGIMGLHSRQQRRRSPARSGWTARSCVGADPERGAQAARPRDGDDLPGPAVRAAPVLHGRRADRRGLPGAPPASSRRRPASAPSSCSTGSASRSPQRGSTTTRTSSPAVCASAP